MTKAKTGADNLQKLERQAKALELRRAGMDFREIARKLGISKSVAHRYVVAGMQSAREQITAGAETLRAEELSRLDALQESLWPRARKGELPAVDRVLKIAERRQKLLGLEAPVRIEATGRDGKPIEVSSTMTIDPSKLSTAALQELLDARTAAE